MNYVWDECMSVNKGCTLIGQSQPQRVCKGGSQCASVSVHVRACVCVLLSLCLGIQIREADYILEDGNRWREKEEGDNYVELMLKLRLVRTHPGWAVFHLLSISDSCVMSFALWFSFRTRWSSIAINMPNGQKESPPQCPILCLPDMKRGVIKTIHWLWCMRFGFWVEEKN